MNLSIVLEAGVQIFEFLWANPILSATLILTYVLYYIYLFMNSMEEDTDIFEIDLFSSGVSSAMLALLLVGLEESTNELSLANIDFAAPTSRFALILLVYAGIMMFFAFIKVLPKFLVVMLGNREVNLFVNLVAMMMADTSFQLGETHLIALGAPLFVLFLIQRIRRGLSSI